jgi:hypothetical protein
VALRQTLRFVRTHTVELRYELHEQGGLEHASTLQEIPTVYSANGEGGPDLWRLLDATGAQVDIDVPAGNDDGFNYVNMTSPEPWVTMQNDDGSYGVGILYENGETDFQGWQLRSLPFNNVRALASFGIPAHGSVTARAYLMIGSFSTIATEAAWLQANLAPFGWLDGPDETADSGTITLSGWALDNRGVASVYALIDETERVDLSYGASRPDVCTAWPGYPDCDVVGFTGTYDLGAPQPCPHLVEIVATDTDGNERTIARRLVSWGE